MNKVFVGIKAVGFDVDRTLFHSPTAWSEKVGVEVIDWAARELGRERGEFESEYVKRREKYGSNTLTLESFGLNGEAIFQAVFDKFPIDRFVKKDHKLIKLIDGLKSKYRLFIITNGTERQVVHKFKLLGLDPADFNPFVCAYDHGWAKPEPAPFLYALEKLKMKPEEVVYVGDRAEVDIEGARAVGMKTILVGGKKGAANASCEAVKDILTIL